MARPLDRAELEGFLDGVARRIAEARERGPEDPSWVREWEEARARLGLDDLVAADRILRALDVRLEALVPEMELTEHPRGLVGYTPKGDRGVPPGPEEEALANRMRLIGRLLSVRASDGHDIEAPRQHLRNAQAAYAAGDRAAARRETDRAHALLERMASRASGERIR